MVRTIILVSAVLALVATVSAGPLISAKADRHIGTEDVTIKNTANNLITLDNLHAHGKKKSINVRMKLTFSYINRYGTRC